ncbi:SCO6745 family protein [Micromonospora echinofusca]|uniref:Uncharacterized protein n=1 Tax=Micromonospora echinofusca TaxID=47858 RepID=A0ABS3VMM3_MICEH|nr:hypothetical protein [Micromonospora echinofusca]MBO4205801.1 hypothetical protein [Micromonospora echinofusca]
MTPEQTAAASKPLVVEVGGAFHQWPGTLHRARLLGISSWAFYVAGRGGALGDVRAGTVAAALGFIAPDAVADGWDAVVRVTSPAEVATVSYTECCRWGAEHLSDLPGLDRLVELTGRAVAAADPTGMPLFAAWRAMPVPDGSSGARAAAHLHVLRELFIGAHLIAVRAAGMTPLAAVVAGPEGPAGAVACGWPPPYPAVAPLVRRRIWAESVTDRLVSPAFAGLDPVERTELVDLLDVARGRLGPDRPTGQIVPSGNG